MSAGSRLARSAVALGLVATSLGCVHAPDVPVVAEPAPFVPAAATIAPAGPVPPVAPVVPEPACAVDLDCGLDVARDRCVADPLAAHQPPLVDQGVLCFCEESRCRTLRVEPIPCESDASCAVSLTPRPHPVPARHLTQGDAPARCADDGAHFVFSATCERTNICTMKTTARGPRTRPCPAR